MTSLNNILSLMTSLIWYFILLWLISPKKLLYYVIDNFSTLIFGILWRHQTILTFKDINDMTISLIMTLFLQKITFYDVISRNFLPSNKTLSEIISLSSIDSAWLSLCSLPFLSFSEATIERTCSISLSRFSSSVAASPVDVSDDVIIGGTESVDGIWPEGDGARCMLS